MAHYDPDTGIPPTRAGLGFPSETTKQSKEKTPISRPSKRKCLLLCLYSKEDLSSLGREQVCLMRVEVGIKGGFFISKITYMYPFRLLPLESHHMVQIQRSGQGAVRKRSKK